jgi:hypothetical protein
MAVDRSAPAVGEDGPEPLAGQHWSPLIVEVYVESVRLPVGEVGRDGWWDDVPRALNH